MARQSRRKYYSFLDLPAFTAAWTKELKLTDDDLCALEEWILVDPHRFPVIRGTAGLRKTRFAPPSWNVGKRGALRVCYVVFAAFNTIVLATAYAKRAKEDLTGEERAVLNGLIRDVEMELRRLKQP